MLARPGLNVSQRLLISGQPLNLLEVRSEPAQARVNCSVHGLKNVNVSESSLEVKFLSFVANCHNGLQTDYTESKFSLRT